MSVFAGTWIANIEKSRRHDNHQFERATLGFDVSGDVITLTHGGVNAAGKQESGTTVLCSDGQDHAVSPLAPGVVVATRWRGANVLETVAKKDGEVVGDGTYEVSTDGRRSPQPSRGLTGPARVSSRSSCSIADRPAAQRFRPETTSRAAPPMIAAAPRSGGSGIVSRVFVVASSGPMSRTFFSRV